MVNIIVVEDNPVFTEALVSKLEAMDDLNVVKVFDTAERALQELDDLDIDLALVDISLPGMNGIDFVEEVHQRNAEILHLMVSGNIADVHVRRAMEVGARGFVKKENASRIGTAICDVLEGKIYKD